MGHPRAISFVVVFLLAGCEGQVKHESVAKDAPWSPPDQVEVVDPSHPVFRPKLLFESIPSPVRKQLFHMSEVDIATVIRLANTKDEVVETLKLLVSPGQKIEGWICKVHWAILRDKGGSSKYDYTDIPPVYEFTFGFPETVLDHEVWIWGHNYNFKSRQVSIANDKLKGIKDGDWVRISGVFRPGTKVEWGFTKSSEYLSIGEITLSDIEKLDVEGKTSQP